MTHRPWLATYRECGIPAQIDPNAHRSVVHLLEEAMKKYADKPAFRSFGQTLTYADVDRQSRNFAAYLQKKLGVEKGDRIAVMTPNLLAFPMAFLGVIRAGAAQVNVNPLYTPRELEHQLNDAGVRIMVVFAGSSATVAEVIASSPLKTVITVGPGDGSAATLARPPVDPRLSGALAFSDTLAEGAKLAFDPVDLNGDDLLFLQYTGGTTGLSKGASLSHRNLVANTEQFKAAMGSAPPSAEDVVVTAIRSTCRSRLGMLDMGSMSNTTRYGVLIDGRRGDYGVVFPDLPGCKHPRRGFAARHGGGQRMGASCLSPAPAIAGGIARR
jgi:long-chain acyl-CoA synthetase